VKLMNLPPTHDPPDEIRGAAENSFQQEIAVWHKLRAPRPSCRSAHKLLFQESVHLLYCVVGAGAGTPTSCRSETALSRAVLYCTVWLA